MAAGYLNNDNVLWLTAHDIDGAEDTGATVTAVVQDKSGATVETGIAMPYVVARGRYEGQPDEDQWTRGRHYEAVISVTGSEGEEGEIVVTIYADRRRAS